MLKNIFSSPYDLLTRWFKRWQSLRHTSKVGYVASWLGIISPIASLILYFLSAAIPSKPDNINVSLVAENSLKTVENEDFDIENDDSPSYRDPRQLLGYRKTSFLMGYSHPYYNELSSNFHYLNFESLLNNLLSKNHRMLEDIPKIPVHWSDEEFKFSPQLNTKVLKGKFYAKVGGEIPYIPSAKPSEPSSWSIAALECDLASVCRYTFNGFVIWSPEINMDTDDLIHNNVIEKFISNHPQNGSILCKAFDRSQETIVAKYNDYILWSYCSRGGSNPMNHCALVIETDDERVYPEQDYYEDCSGWLGSIYK